MSTALYALVKASEQVKDLLGDPPRFYVFGEADQNTKRPYAVQQMAYGAPENKLAGVPDEDTHGIQIDVYALTAAEARAIGVALRDAIEPAAYIVSWQGESREPDTKLYRFSFVVELMTARA